MGKQLFQSSLTKIKAAKSGMEKTSNTINLISKCLSTISLVNSCLITNLYPFYTEIINLGYTILEELIEDQFKISY